MHYLEIMHNFTFAFLISLFQNIEQEKEFKVEEYGEFMQKMSRANE